MDQSLYNKKDVLVEKAESQVNLDGGAANGRFEPDNHKNNPDNTLLSNSNVMRGEGRAIVCAVGRHTVLSRNRKAQQLVIKEQNTELEERLEKVSKVIGRYAEIAAVLCFLTQLIYCLFFVCFAEEDNIQLVSNYTLMRIFRIGILALCILIVAIPEGLPLAISIAMALSISNMKRDKILIKNVEAVQRCALLHDICVGKTGTLTEGDMHCGSYHLVNQQEVIKNDYTEAPAHFNNELEVNAELKDLLKEAIISNTDVRIEVDDNHYQYLAKGQATEVGMIDFLMENGESVYDIFINRNRDCAKLIQLPFDQVLKRKTVVRNVANNGASVRIYVKGAPEMVIPMCNSTLNDNILTEPFGQEEQDRTLRLVAEQIAGVGHKPITYAFKEIEKDKLTEIMQRYSNREEEDEYRHEFETGLFYLGTFGLEDPVRPEIENPVSLIKYGHTDPGLDSAPQVNVRMITGDHLETAKAIAVRAGIVSPNELTGSDMCAMTGEEFRRAIGPYQRYWDDETQQEKIAFENLEQFKTIKKRVKIIARATPEDKFILIRGIQQQGGLIGMAGDSIADSEALK